MSRQRSRIDKLIYGTSHVGCKPIPGRGTPTVEIRITDEALTRLQTVTLNGQLQSIEQQHDTSTGLTSIRIELWESK